MKKLMSSLVRINGTIKQSKEVSDLSLSKKQLIDLYAVAPYESDVQCPPRKEDDKQLSLEDDLLGTLSSLDVRLEKQSLGDVSKPYYFRLSVMNGDPFVEVVCIGPYNCQALFWFHSTSMFVTDLPIYADDDCFAYLESLGATFSGNRIDLLRDEYDPRGKTLQEILYDVVGISL